MSTENAWKELLAQQIQNIVLKADELGFNCSATEGKDYIIEQAIKWELGIHDKRLELWVKRYYIPELCRITGEDSDYIVSHLEAAWEQKRKDKHDAIMRETFAAVAEAIEGNSFERAKELIADGVIKAEGALAEQMPKPRRLLSECVGDMRARFKSLQGVQYPGLVQKTLPELDDATGGLWGFVLINAKSGEGKTNLALSCLLDILTHQDDVCGLFISRDMLEERSWDRMVSNRASLPIRALQSGSQATGWTPEEAIAAETGIRAIERLGSRISILDRFHLPNPSRLNIKEARERLMDETGCSRSVVIVDFLQKTWCPPHLKGLDSDDYRSDEMRALADEVGTVLCITESNKSGMNYERGAPENVKGSNRIVMNADMVFTLSAFGEEELVNTWDEHNGVIVRRNAPFEGTTKESKKLAVRVRKLLTARGEAPATLTIGKARDGARKAEFPVIHFFEKNSFASLRSM